MITIAVTMVGTVVSVLAAQIMFGVGLSGSLFAAAFLAMSYYVLALILLAALRRLPLRVFAVCAALGGLTTTLGTIGVLLDVHLSPPDAQGALIFLSAWFWSAPMCGYGLLAAAIVILLRMQRAQGESG